MSDRHDVGRRSHSLSALSKIGVEHGNAQPARKLSVPLVPNGNQPADIQLRAPGQNPPRLSRQDYLKSLKYHPLHRWENVTDTLVHQNRDRLVDDALVKMKGGQNRRFYDKKIGSEGTAGIAGKRLRVITVGDGGPAASHLQRAVLLRKKASLLSQVRRHVQDLNVAEIRIPGRNRLETKADAQSRVEGGLSRLKGSIRELLIVAYAQRNALRSRRDSGLIDHDAHFDLEKELTESIAKLMEIDEDVLNVKEGLALRGQKAIADAQQRMRDLDRSNPNSPFEAGPPRVSPAYRNELLRRVRHDMSEDIGQVRAGMAAVARRLERAWQREPLFLAKLGYETPKAAADNELAENYRLHSLRDAVDVYDDYQALHTNALKTGKPPPNKTAEQAMFDVAEKAGMAKELEVHCRAQIEKSVVGLEERLKFYKIPGLDVADKNSVFGRDFATMKSLSEQMTIRRHFDDIDQKMDQLDAELSRLTELASLDDSRGPSRSWIDDRHAVTRGVKDELARERDALRISALDAGIPVDNMSSIGDLASDFDGVRDRVSQRIKHHSKKYVDAVYVSKGRTKKADDLRNNLKKIEILAEEQNKFSLNAVGGKSRKGWTMWVTKAELHAVRGDWDAERGAIELERNGQSIWRKAGNSLSRLWERLFGNTYKLGISKNVFKGLDSSLDSIARSEAARLAAFDPTVHSLDMASSVLDGAEHGLGVLASAAGIKDAADQISAVKDKRKQGRALCEQYDKALGGIENGIVKSKTSHADRVVMYRGQQLQSVPMASHGVHVGIRSLAAARHAYLLFNPAFAEPLHAAAPLAGAAGYVGGFALSGTEALIAAYNTNQAFISRERIEDAVLAQRNRFRFDCENLGLRPTEFLSFEGKPDFPKARQAIEKGDLSENQKQDALKALGELAEMEALVSFLKDRQNVDEKLLLTSTKTLSALGYGVAAGLLLTAVAGGALVAAPVAGLAATTGGLTYYTYKTAKKNYVGYKAERAADAALGVADPKVIAKLQASADKRGISANQMALDLVAATSNKSKAENLLGKLRWECRDLRPSVEEIQRRAELESDVEPLRREMERLHKEGPQQKLAQVYEKWQPKAEALQRLMADMETRIVAGSPTAQYLRNSGILSAEVLQSLVEADPKHDVICTSIVADAIACK